MKSLREHSKARSNAKIAKYMKGGSASNCYASGGTVKAAAAKKREDMPPVEGKAARPRLDRPGRRMKRAEGGSTISEDSKREARRLRREGTQDIGLSGATHLPIAGITAMGTVMPRVNPLVRGALAATSGYNANQFVKSVDRSRQDEAEANRIEAGRVKPGEEDRKKGGRVKK